MPTPTYEVFAIRYAEIRDRPATDVFVDGDPHEAPLDMDYFVWLIKGTGGPVVIDTGFTKVMAEKRGRTFVQCPGETLLALGVEPESVNTLIVSHLHYDHFGNLGLFPQADLHIQDREVAFATGRMMNHRNFSAPYEVEDVVDMVRSVHGGRVHFHDGDWTLRPGIECYLAPGHTAGHQFVRVHTEKGWMVLAVDAAHYRQQFERGRLFSIVYDAAEMVESYQRLKELADDELLIIPGHDPWVTESFPAVSPALVGLAMRLA